MCHDMCLHRIEKIVCYTTLQIPGIIDLTDSNRDAPIYAGHTMCVINIDRIIMFEEVAKMLGLLF